MRKGIMLRNGLAAGCSQPSQYTDFSALQSPQLWLESDAWNVPFASARGFGLGLETIEGAMQRYGWNDRDFIYYGYEVSVLRCDHLVPTQQMFCVYFQQTIAAMN